MVSMSRSSELVQEKLTVRSRASMVFLDSTMSVFGHVPNVTRKNPSCRLFEDTEDRIFALGSAGQPSSERNAYSQFGNFL